MSGLMRQIFSKINHFTKCNNPNIQQFKPFIFQSTQRLYANAPAPTPYEVVDPNEQKNLTKEVVNKINNQVAKAEHGRLFAVVHVAGKQFKITQGDVIVIEGYWPPDTGEKISLDKVLLLGSTDFTLIGRPLIQRGLTKIEATVIEKTLSHTKTHFRKKRRKQYKRIHFYRIPQTMLRINNIELVGELNNPPDVTGLEKVVF